MKIKNLLEKKIVTGYAIVTRRGNFAPFNNQYPGGIHFYENKESAISEKNNHNECFRKEWKVVDAILLLDDK